MKQLNLFLKQLRDKGFSCQCNWQKDLSFGSSFEHYRIMNEKNKKFFMIIFQVYGDDKGFSAYAELPGNDINSIHAYIEERLK